jgi:hypothetical protein
VSAAVVADGRYAALADGGSEFAARASSATSTAESTS